MTALKYLELISKKIKKYQWRAFNCLIMDSFKTRIIVILYKPLKITNIQNIFFDPGKR